MSRFDLFGVWVSLSFQVASLIPVALSAVETIADEKSEHPLFRLGPGAKSGKLTHLDPAA
jgi:hypothetical protein